MTSALFTGAKHAQLYAKFRPSPPDSFIKSIIEYLKNQKYHCTATVKKLNPPYKKALDIGCGSGQSTIVLSPHFEKVLGIDVSEAQIECAKQLHSSNVEYKVSKGEKLPVNRCSVELVTLCQSVHWFNADELFTEVQRVLKPNGVIAAYGYWIPIPKIDDEAKNHKIIHLIMNYLHDEKLGTYWDKERYIVQNHYASINLPFKNIQRLSLVKKTESSLADYIGYLSTWSSYQKLYKEDSEKAMELLSEIENKLILILGEDKSSELALNLYSDYFMIMGHK